nr:hypothetical protein [Telmatospirillum sp. J64-1]
MSARRCPADPLSVWRFWACSERTRTSRPDGVSNSRSPTETWPLKAVPVTTTPAPARVKARSTASRNPPSALRRVMAAFSDRQEEMTSTPRPSRTEVRMIGASARPVPDSRARMSAVTAARRSSSTKSALVRATIPCDRPSRSRICRCSTVWGITPSSAATTSKAKSRPETPASML